MSGNFAIKGGGVGRLMANAILNFHFDFLTPSLTRFLVHNHFFENLAGVKRNIPQHIPFYTLQNFSKTIIYTSA